MNKDDLPPRDIDLSRMSKNEFHEKQNVHIKNVKKTGLLKLKFILLNLGQHIPFKNKNR